MIRYNINDVKLYQSVIYILYNNKGIVLVKNFNNKKFVNCYNLFLILIIKRYLEEVMKGRNQIYSIKYTVKINKKK